MARPIWKGSISFGLVTIPVTLFSAENREEELHFTLLDSRNNAKVKYQRVNSVTGEEVPWDTIVKGYEYEHGEYVLLGEEDFKRAAVEATQTISIEDFVDRDAVDFVFYDKPYYLVPAKGGEKAYVLLRDVLAKTNKIGIAKVVIRTRQYLSALIAEGDALVLDIVRFANELRTADELGLPEATKKAGKVKPQELEMAEKLVETMSGEWKPEKYHDEYRDKLMTWIKKKVAAGEMSPAAAVEGEEEEDAPPAPINIMDLLKKSVEGKHGRGAGHGSHAGHQAGETSRTATESKRKPAKAAGRTAKSKAVHTRKRAG